MSFRRSRTECVASFTFASFASLASLASFGAPAVLAALAVGGCFSDPAATGSPGPTTSTTGATGPQGCTVSGAATVYAPDGYYTNGSQVCRWDGTKHVFHGVDRPSFEWEPTGQDISGADFAAMADWHANVVRIALNQDFWLSTAAVYDGNYAYAVDQAVKEAEAVGLDVILDLHWSDRGDLTVPQAGGTFPNSMKYVPSDTAGYSVQQPMADANSVTFWSQVADKYKGDGHVIFELYNEPNGISWDVWLNGGTTGGFQAAGMQQLYDAVRATGAENLVIAGGVNWAFDLSGVASHPIVGHNIMYASHPYKNNDSQAQWPTAFGYLAAQNIAPVIITEFGDNRSNTCTGDWDQALITYAAGANLQISWTAWAWFPGDPCQFPALITDFGRYDTTAQGAVVRAALMNDPKPVPWIEAGAPDTDAAADATVDGNAPDAAGDGGDSDAPSDVDASSPDASSPDASSADASSADASSTPDASDAGTD
jgi:aryl-phospho-beta-D-glucosidase BglC (GH1 family)